MSKPVLFSTHTNTFPINIQCNFRTFLEFIQYLFDTYSGKIEHSLNENYKLFKLRLLKKEDL